MKLSAFLLWALPAILVAADDQTKRTTHTRTHTTKACQGPVISTLRQDPDAKSFCSSFLWTTAVRTSTKSTATVTVRTTLSKGTATVTKTFTKTKVVSSTTTPVTTTTSVSFSNAAISCASSAGYLQGSVLGGDNKALDKRTRTKASYTTPGAFSGQPSASISSLCHCLYVGVRTRTSRTTIAKSTTTFTKTIMPTRKVRTTTVRMTITKTKTSTITGPTSTHTATSIQPLPTTFNGLNWYAYPNSYDFSGTPNVDVTQFNSPHYEDSGMVKNPPTVAGGNNAQCSLPGSSKSLNCVQITVVMQGYLYAPADGLYTLTTGGSDATHVDNYVGLWTGSTAYNTYNNNNAQFIAIRESQSTVQKGGTASFQLNKGQLVPVTLIYMNGGYQGNFQFQIITPDGKVNSDTSNFWIPACKSPNMFSP